MEKEVEIKNVSMVFSSKTGNVQAIKDVSFDVGKNEFISIVGPSGCGKSTLLNIIGGLDKVMVAAGPDAIDAELQKAKVLLPQGGFVPYIDHLVPQDIPWRHFEYYRKRLNEIVQTTPVLGDGAAGPR